MAEGLPPGLVPEAAAARMPETGARFSEGSAAREDETHALHPSE
jgi:hypothetical protein